MPYNTGVSILLRNKLMLGKNHLIFGAAALPYVTGAGLAIYENDPEAAAFYALGTIAPDIDSDGGNSLIVQTFSFKIGGTRISPLAPVSGIIYHLFGHRAVMHYPEVWLFISWLMFVSGVSMKNCYFFFLGCIAHLVGDGITVGGLPVPPTLRIIIWAIRAIYALVNKKPLKSIPMLWERKGFPPANSNGGQVSFQDLTYENRFFLIPKFMRFRVGGPMEIVALVILVTICGILVDPFGNF